VLTDLLKTYKLTSDFSRTGFYASKALSRLEETLAEHMRLGHFVALTGPVGAGKTTLIHKVKGGVQKSKAMVISESQTLEQEKVTIALIVQALFMDFGEKLDRDRESRDRKLFQRIEKSPRPVVLCIDDVHRLPAQTLAGLKGLVEKQLGVVLVGHPRLGFKLAGGLMEEIGLRCEHLEMRGLEGGVEPYLAWLLAPLNLSEFVGGRNGQSTSQILPSWLYWQWLDLTPPARSAPPVEGIPLTNVLQELKEPEVP
jgi:type II secretory pathway predicted ATPase ExeA